MRESVRTRCKAFSMVELLVVIAIIMVLAAILFPVLARAKARAKQTTCMSNLHQLALKREIDFIHADLPCPLSENEFRGVSYYRLQGRELIEALDQADPGHATVICYLHGEHVGRGVLASDFPGTVLRMRPEGSVQVRKINVGCLDGVPMRPDWMLFSDEPCPPEFCPAGLQPCP